MANSTSFISNNQPNTVIQPQLKCFYAVYDCCITDGNPSWDAAFIEERSFEGDNYDPLDSSEKYFPSLSVAKQYVNIHFRSGAEYYSLQQSNDPDNFLYMLTDKIRYLIA